MASRNLKIHRRWEEEEEEEEKEKEEFLCLCYKSFMVILLIIAQSMRKVIITPRLWLKDSDSPPPLLERANLIGKHRSMSQCSGGTNSAESIKNLICVWWCWWQHQSSSSNGISNNNLYCIPGKILPICGSWPQLLWLQCKGLVGAPDIRVPWLTGK